MQQHLALLDKLQITSVSNSPVISLARVEQGGYDRYDAVYIPGGHAPMQDLLYSAPLGRLLANFHQQGKPTALVCHGPIALLSTRWRSRRRSPGRWKPAPRPARRQPGFTRATR
jgi:putative intracellular protease/amidase